VEDGKKTTETLESLCDTPQQLGAVDHTPDENQMRSSVPPQCVDESHMSAHH
jgi:hypothetical protein